MHFLRIMYFLQNAAVQTPPQAIIDRVSDETNPIHQTTRRLVNGLFRFVSSSLPWIFTTLALFIVVAKGKLSILSKLIAILCSPVVDDRLVSSQIKFYFDSVMEWGIHHQTVDNV